MIGHIIQNHGPTAFNVICDGVDGPILLTPFTDMYAVVLRIEIPKTGLVKFSVGPAPDGWQTAPRSFGNSYLPE